MTPMDKLRINAQYGKTGYPLILVWAPIVFLPLAVIAARVLNARIPAIVTITMIALAAFVIGEIVARVARLILRHTYATAWAAGIVAVMLVETLLVR